MLSSFDLFESLERGRWKHHPACTPLQLNKTEVCIERDGSFVFCIDDDSCNGQNCAGLSNLLTGIGKQNRTQPFALEFYGYSEPTNQRNRHWVAGQFSRQRFRQVGAIHTSRTQRKESSQLLRIAYGCGNKDSGYIFAYVLRCIAADVVIQRLATALEARSLDRSIKRFDLIGYHRRT